MLWPRGQSDWQAELGVEDPGGETRQLDSEDPRPRKGVSIRGEIPSTKS